MHDFQKLLALLQKELSHQEKLLSLLARERAAIVKLNQEEIEKISAEKQSLLDGAQEVQNRCAEVIQGMAAPDQPKAPVKLAEVVSKCPAPDLRKQLSSITGELKRTVETVRDLHNTNTVLIRQSLGIIASTVAILSSGSEEALPTYSGRGKMGRREDKPLASRPRTLVRGA